ncbi:hypothetical protein SeMB42_g06382 [Synchytrium endobioticum]|uniref:RNA polymerase II-associated factor 1 homolog n=1 Tax=Synchytrium endobioticum TaxID=286115 RepID=A0A507CLE9_9FUNG|nr:hypothetical protein SeMB42_g06382 [Synchytrium endobioticum]
MSAGSKQASSSSSRSSTVASPALKAAPNQPPLGWEYAAHPRYRNPLPDLPFDPKLITPKFSLEPHYAYKAEEQTAFEGDFSLGVNTADDLFGTSLNWTEMGILEKADPYAPVPVYLPKPPTTSGALSTPSATPGRRPSSAENRNLSWLRRTTYIASDSKPRGWNEEVISATRKKVVNDPLGEDLMKDPSIETQLRLIESTFRSVQEGLDDLDTLEHPTKKGVTAVEVIPVYPDFQIYGTDYLIVNFDEEPFPAKQDDEMTQTALEEAILIAAEDNTTSYPSKSGRYMTLYKPDEETTRKMVTKRKRGEEFGDDPNTVYYYSSVRDYDYNIMTFDYRIPITEEEEKRPKKRTIDAPSDDRYKRLCISIRDVGEGRGAFFYQFEQALGLKKRRVLNTKKGHKRATHHLELSPRILTTAEIEAKRANLMNILNDEAQVDEQVQEDEEALRQQLEAQGVLSGVEEAHAGVGEGEEVGYEHGNGTRMNENEIDVTYG